jgi:hypothetical protein
MNVEADVLLHMVHHAAFYFVMLVGDAPHGLQQLDEVLSVINDTPRLKTVQFLLGFFIAVL